MIDNTKKVKLRRISQSDGDGAWEENDKLSLCLGKTMMISDLYQAMNLHSSMMKMAKPSGRVKGILSKLTSQNQKKFASSLKTQKMLLVKLILTLQLSLSGNLLALIE
jgi:hypothetical protein